jgi:hypothetical protein
MNDFGIKTHSRLVSLIPFAFFNAPQKCVKIYAMVISLAFSALYMARLGLDENLEWNFYTIFFISPIYIIYFFLSSYIYINV